MTREDFRVIPNFYTTTTLTYILLGTKVVGYVEVFENYGFVDDKEDTTSKTKKKSTKKKRTPDAINKEIESFIKKYIDLNG